MQTVLDADRQLTELDFARLQKLRLNGSPEALVRLLDDVDVVPGKEVDADVVTMYTQFELEDGERAGDAKGGSRRIIVICYPQDAEPAAGYVSVLSPLGCSAIGQRTGSAISWSTPGGVVTGRIGAILFQPEASGDYLT